MKEYPSLVVPGIDNGLKPLIQKDDTYFSIVNKNKTLFKIKTVNELFTMSSRKNDKYYCNQYKMLDTIGQGQFAKIVKAVTPGGTYVALKQFRKKPINHQSQYSFKQIQFCMQRTTNTTTSTTSGTSGTSTPRTSDGNDKNKKTVDDCIMEMTLNKIRWELYVLGKVQSNKNIITLLDCIDSQYSKKNWIVLEMCELGEIHWQNETSSLSPFVKQLDILYPKKKGEEEGRESKFMKFSLKFLIDVISGLKFLNEKGCIHRDIKPSNILLSRSNQDEVVFKICDFGSSIIHPDYLPDLSIDKTTIFTKFQNELNKIVGTPAFIPPEICNFSTTTLITQSSSSSSSPEKTSSLIHILDGYKLDMWSFGATFFCILYGTLPFEGDNEFETFNKIVNEDFSVSNNASLLDLRSDIETVDANHSIDILRFMQELCLQDLLNKDPHSRIDIEELYQNIMPLVVNYYNDFNLATSKSTNVLITPTKKKKKLIVQDKESSKNFKEYFLSKLKPSPKRPTTKSNESSPKHIIVETTPPRDNISISSNSSINSDFDNEDGVTNTTNTTTTTTGNKVINLSDFDSDEEENDDESEEEEMDEIVKINTNEIIERANIAHSPTASPLRSSGSNDKTQSNGPRLVQSRGTIDFSKYLQNEELEYPKIKPKTTSGKLVEEKKSLDKKNLKKIYRSTFFRDSIVNFESADELKRYLNYADPNSSKR